MTANKEKEKVKMEEKNKMSEEKKEKENESVEQVKEELEEEEEGKEKEPEKTEEEIEREELGKLEKSDLIDKLMEKDTLLKEKEEELKKQKDWKNKFMHLQADFENAQKRWDRSRGDLRKQAQANVLKDFLPLYDSFTKALESDGESILKQFYNQYLNLCKSYKAEPMEIQKGDKFNYDFQEAITTLENENLPENSIIDVVQNGWKIDKDVLRYAKVVISKKPKPPEPEPEPKSEDEKAEESAEESDTDASKDQEEIEDAE